MDETHSDPAPKSEAPKPPDPRGRIVDALLLLAAERDFEEISIRDISAAANVSLADFRDAFPSKGAVLAGLSRRIDRAVLNQSAEETSAETPRDRLFDVLMRRFDAMAPYRDGLRGVYAWLRRDPTAMLAMNRGAVNSMRFMLEAAGIDSEGVVGAVKLQGLALAWARVFRVWLDDSGPDFAKTMAALDRELTQGQRWISGVEQLDRLASPLRAIARAAMEGRSRARDGFRRRPREEAPTEEAEAR
jgi:AcrR family transcriptional regulator